MKKRAAPSPAAGSVRSTQELADYLGLSRWTVSRALNGHSNVQPATVQRVREAAQALGFVPNALAQDLRRGHSHLVGVMLPGLAAYNLSDKIERLSGALAERGHQTLFSIVPQDGEAPLAAVAQLLGLRVAGILTFAADWGHALFPNAVLRRENTPVVHIDPVAVKYGRVVRTDREAAMCAIVQMLADRGHRRISVVGVDPSTTYGRQRVEGLIKGCATGGLAWQKEVRLEPLKPADNPMQEGAGYAAVLAALAPGRKRPTAVVALNDAIALGVIRHFQSLGLRVPGKVSVVGYDNAAFAALAAPPLTTVEPKTEALIDLAVEKLLAWNPRESGREARIRPELVNRASVGFAKA
jgi:DNA-binding LacI/PurR family transcriptional regulator